MVDQRRYGAEGRAESTVFDMPCRLFRPVTSAFTIAAVSLLLAGCFTVEASFTINDDATADLDYLILIDTEQLEDLAGLLGEDVDALGDLSGDALLDEFTDGDDPCADLTASLTDYDVSTRQIDDDGDVGVGCSVSGVPVSELSSLGDDTSSFSIEQDDDGTRFNAVLEGVDELAGDPSETEMFTELLGISLDDLFTIRFIVTAPGSLGDNNASSTDGSKATWDVKPDADFVTDGDATMTAEWTPGGGSGGSSVIIILAIIAVVAVIAAVAVMLVKRSKGQRSMSGSSDALAATPSPATPTSPGAPHHHHHPLPPRRRRARRRRRSPNQRMVHLRARLRHHLRARTCEPATSGLTVTARLSQPPAPSLPTDPRRGAGARRGDASDDR